MLLAVFIMAALENLINKDAISNRTPQEGIMKQMHIADNTYVHCVPEPRRYSQRHTVYHMLVVTEKGTGQIIDFSSNGLSFGCLYPHEFDDIFQLDILDAKGTHIKQVQAKKIWQRNGSRAIHPERFEMEIGVEFIGLSNRQFEDLGILAEKLYSLIYYSN